MASFVSPQVFLLPPVPPTSGVRVRPCTPATRALSTRDTELLTSECDQSTSVPDVQTW